ncbi:IS1595 family transposase [Pollutibacter soli]|uniref:IS1595 family transposase n=1 Tax=Pollutibacter soli TaxID=3034157 RepID=UPI003014183C
MVYEVYNIFNPGEQARFIANNRSMFRGLSINQFNKKFATDEDCRKYLFQIKWGIGYQCRKCNHTRYYKGETVFHLRCRLCDYDESVTAGTLFHKIKFPLVKAFGIAFTVCVRKKGMSTLELGKKFGIRQTTAWLFKRKLQEAMKDPKSHAYLPNEFEVHDVIISGTKKDGASKEYTSFQNVKIVFYSDNDRRILGNATVINNSDKSTSDLNSLACLHNIRKRKLKNHDTLIDNLSQRQKKSGKYYRVKNFGDIIIMNLHNWLNGIHHHCSERFLMGYLNEFFFRFNHRERLSQVMHIILERIMFEQPYFHKPSRPKWLIPSRSKAIHP